MSVVAVMALVAAGCALDSAPERRTYIVAMKEFAFQPDTLRAALGDTIVWTNHDVVPHTATAADWDSGVVEASGSWRLVVADTGTHDYLCALHPAMTGTLMVR